MTQTMELKDEVRSAIAEAFWSPHQPELYVGNSGKDAPVLQVVPWYRAHVTKLSAWKDTYESMPMIKCLMIDFAGDSLIYGNGGHIIPGRYPDAEISLDADEKIYSLVLWGNGKATRLGRIDFRTNKNKHFDTGSCDGKQGYAAACGTGVWGGIKIRSDADVDGIEFMFVDLATEGAKGTFSSKDSVADSVAP